MRAGVPLATWEVCDPPRVFLARAVGRNQQEVLWGLRASKASTLRSQRYSVRSVLRVWRSQSTRRRYRKMRRWSAL